MYDLFLKTYTYVLMGFALSMFTSGCNTEYDHWTYNKILPFIVNNFKPCFISEGSQM